MKPDISQDGFHDGEPAPRSRPPDIPGFDIVRKIGEGGMGAVYEAWQEHPHRRVAIKFARAGVISADGLKRLGYEAEVLGRLEHPNIARLYAAGSVVSGSLVQPYIVMELIDGQPVSRYVIEKDLTLRQRIQLMQQIARAVHFAHQQGVIHRDLKPGNILIDAGGMPRILDFDLARAADLYLQSDESPEDVLAGTPSYMSPEQTMGRTAPVDARTDIYSLGVVLFEILTGALPYNLKGMSRGEMIRTIREQVPVSLRTMNPRLKGDLEHITARALEKQRDARYESAAALADDLACFIEDRPIRARPATFFYVTGKFARRHMIGVSAGIAIVLALAGGLIAATVSLQRAREAEAVAKENLQKAVRSVDQMTSYIADSQLAGIEGADPIREELFRNAVSLYESLIQGNPDDPKVKNEMSWVLERLAQTARTSGDFDYTIQILEKQIGLMRDMIASDPAQAYKHTRALSQAIFNLSRVLDRKGDRAAAARGIEEAIGLYRQLLALNPADTEIRIEVAYLHGNWARVLDDGEARAKYEEALAMWEQLKREFPDDHDIDKSISWTRKRLGELENGTGISPEDAADALVLDGTNHDALMDAVGRMVVVTGRVQYIGINRGRNLYTFIDFGRKKRAFAGVIHRNILPRFAAVYGEKLDRLLGQDVEIRGVMTALNDSPQVSLSRPEQIHITSNWQAGRPEDLVAIDGTDGDAIRAQAGRPLKVRGTVTRTGGTTENRQFYLAIDGEKDKGSSVILPRELLADFARALGTHPSSLTGRVIEAIGHVYMYGDWPCVELDSTEDLRLADQGDLAPTQ